jgi:hypothetical protein
VGDGGACTQWGYDCSDQARPHEPSCGPTLGLTFFDAVVVGLAAMEEKPRATAYAVALKPVAQPRGKVEGAGRPRGRVPLTAGMLSWAAWRTGARVACACCASCRRGRGVEQQATHKHQSGEYEGCLPPQSAVEPMGCWCTGGAQWQRSRMRPTRSPTASHARTHLSDAAVEAGQAQPSVALEPPRAPCEKRRQHTQATETAQGRVAAAANQSACA